jgi:DNA-binding XRE family transcriptional regulator
MRSRRRSLEVRLVGVDPPLRKRIREIWHPVKVEGWATPHPSSPLRADVPNAIWIVGFAMPAAESTDRVRRLFDLSRVHAPLILFPGSKRGETRLLPPSIQFLELLGAQVFAGQRGPEQVCELLREASLRDHAELIVGVQLSDAGLRVSFGDGAVAVVQLPRLRRLAESPNLLWDSLRIGPNRTYLTVANSGGEIIPLPQDVLRESVAEGKEQREAAHTRERRLTGRRFGARLRSVREDSGLTQEELAARARTSRWTVHRIEKGTYLPKVALLQRLSGALEQDMSELLGR